ncbi:chitinase-3-like protein 1 isoform X2 [Scylla paramamosain]|uniref:chitinase-3-like protein 1 isoform X2 n=1 Tax=Scylla paramamosain TaxID=85552 RepID=UPI00308347AA
MWRATCVLVVVCCAAATTQSVSSQVKVTTTPKKLLCHYNLPCPGQRPPAPLPLSALDPSLCTHIIISSAVVHNTTIQPCTPGDTKVYKEVVSLKKQHPKLQVLVRVEGNWTTLIHDAQAVAVFAYNAGKFLRTLDLDGLEVAWQPPTWPPWESGTVQQVSLLLLQLNNALQLASHPPFTLSMAVSASQNSIDHAYDITVINRLLSSSWTKVGAPAVGLGLMEGRMTHPQVCTFVQKGSAWHWDKASRVPYAWRSRDWISYEDESSVKEKAQLVVTEDLAGVAVLDLNSDDWGGLCPRATTFPLLRAAKNVLSRSDS